MNSQIVELNLRQLLDITKISSGAFAPLTGFLNAENFRGVVDTMHLADGSPWTIPIILNVPESFEAQPGEEVTLTFQGGVLASLQVDEVYDYDPVYYCQQVFGTINSEHPSVLELMSVPPRAVGGRVELLNAPHFEWTPHELSPAEVRMVVQRRGWSTVAGFHTRNAPHRAHEYLIRCCLELYDAVLVHPVVGVKKPGDASLEEILAGYNELIENYLPKERIIFCPISMASRYAGPREAVFTALVRKNYGCTHFVVGRDHTGVGSFYGPYESHEIFRSLDHLGIEPLLLKGPFYCHRCDGISTESTCPHEEAHRVRISGTDVRKMMQVGEYPEPFVMRPSVFDALLRCRP